MVNRPERGADHPPHLSAEVEGRVELYVYFPTGPSWPVMGRTFILFRAVSYQTGGRSVCILQSFGENCNLHLQGEKMKVLGSSETSDQLQKTTECHTNNMSAIFMFTNVTLLRQSSLIYRRAVS